MIKAQNSKIKKSTILVCFSVLLSLVLSISAPFSITSKAYAVGLESTQSALDVLLGLGGLSGSRPSNGSDEDWKTLSSMGLSQDAYLALYGGFFDSANNYYSGLGDYLISRIKLATSLGSLMLDQDMYQEYKNFISETYNPSVGDSITIGSYDFDIPVYTTDSIFNTIFDISYKSGGSSTVTSTYTFSDIDTNIVILHTESSSNDIFWFIPYDKQTSSYMSVNNFPSGDGYVGAALYGNSNLGSSIGYIQYAIYQKSSSYASRSITLPFEYLSIGEYSTSNVQYYINTFRLNGTLTLANSIVTTVVDTDSEIVTSDSSIVEDDVTWNTTVISMLDSSVISQLVDYLNSNVITYNDFIKALNLGLVNDSMTEAEKQAVIDGISTGVTNTLTIGETGSAAITQSSSKVGRLAHIEHAIANAIAQAMGKALPYPDEDPDYVPPGDPHIEDWTFPSMDPNNPDPGGSEDPDSEDEERYEDVLTAIPVVSGIASSVFDSASGFNLITTVGYSFVIFSAILGASHFFGALGHHDDVNQRTLYYWDRRSDHWSRSNTDFKSDW